MAMVSGVFWAGLADRPSPNRLEKRSSAAPLVVVFPMHLGFFELRR